MKKGPATTRTTVSLHNAFNRGMAMVLLLMTACATHSPTRQNEALLRDFAARGYDPAEHDPVTTTSQVWQLSGHDVKIVLTEPNRSGTLPVVLYLPGLGEPSESGQRWRTGWASAGYGVVSVQLLEDDAAAWRSDLARTGEFKTLGRQRYDGGVMRRRVQLLADVVAEGQRRTAAHEAGWLQLDWGRMAIAGYDLGAYTALTAAGEHVRGAEDTAGRLQARAAILLSPYANLADGSLDTRFRDVRPPVLSITSDADGDPLGLVEGPHLREAPYLQMAGPDKYLLLLRGLSHAALAGGNDSGDRNSGTSRGSGSAGSEQTGTQRHGSKHSSGDEAGQSGRDRKRTVDDAAATDRSPTAAQMRLIAAQRVSTAFLDAYLMDKPQAREWLASGASQWLGATGELRHK